MSDGMTEAFGRRTASSKKYLVFYVNDGTPEVKKFASKKDALSFVKRISSRSDFHTWVDYVVKGEIILKGDV